MSTTSRSKGTINFHNRTPDHQTDRSSLSGMRPFDLTSRRQQREPDRQCMQCSYCVLAARRDRQLTILTARSKSSCDVRSTRGRWVQFAVTGKVLYIGHRKALLIIVNKWLTATPTGRTVPITHCRASGSFLLPSLVSPDLYDPAQTSSPRRTGLCLIGCNQRICGRQIPTLTELLRRHLMVCHQMPPQHGKMLAAIQTDDVICQHRFLHRHCWFCLRRCGYHLLDGRSALKTCWINPGS